MKKKYFLGLVIILSLLFVNAHAATIDPTATGSMSGMNYYGSKVLDNDDLYLYKIANINAEGELTYVEAFQQAGYELNNLTATQLNTLAINLGKYIADNKVSETAKTVTDEEGKFEFSDLETGLYLLKNDVYTDGSYEYRVLSLTTIPNFNEMDKTYMYDIVALPKVDAKLINAPDDDNNNTSGNNNADNAKDDKKIPNTLDNVYLYVGLLLIAIIGIGITIYCSSKSKRSDKNEKKPEDTDNN